MNEAGSATPQQRADRQRARRLRIAGVAIPVLAIVIAGVRYVVQIRSAQPTLEDLMPGSDAARSRQVAIIIGPFAESLVEGWHYLQRPDMQAALTVGIAAVLALACFRIATLFERSPEAPPPRRGGTTPSGSI